MACDVNCVGAAIKWHSRIYIINMPYVYSPKIIQIEATSATGTRSYASRSTRQTPRRQHIPTHPHTPTYTYPCTHIQPRTHAPTHSNACAHPQLPTPTYARSHTHSPVHACIPTHAHIPPPPHAQESAPTPAPTHVHAHPSTHAHTHKWKKSTINEQNKWTFKVYTTYTFLKSYSELYRVISAFRKLWNLNSLG